LGVEDGGIFYCDGNRPVPETVKEDNADSIPCPEGGWSLVAVGGRLKYDIYEATLLKLRCGAIVCELG